MNFYTSGYRDKGEYIPIEEIKEWEADSVQLRKSLNHYSCFGPYNKIFVFIANFQITFKLLLECHMDESKNFLNPYIDALPWDDAKLQLLNNTKRTYF